MTLTKTFYPLQSLGKTNDSIEDHIIEEKFNKTSNLFQMVKRNIIGNRESRDMPRNHFQIKFIKYSKSNRT